MKKLIGKGDRFTYVNSGSALGSGDVVGLVTSIGVCETDIAADESGEVLVEGVFELTKKSGVAFDQGDYLYWDASPGELTKTNTDIPAGIAYEAAASDAVLAKVKLVPGMGA